MWRGLFVLAVVLPLGAQEMFWRADDAEPASDGTHREMTARVHNDLEEALPNARVVFVAPRGDYAVEGGRLEARTDSDDGRFTVVTTRCDLPAGGGCVVRLVPQR